MRLVSLHLWNLRSYEDARVDFGEGVNLFEGDVGSGKSTILLAIEFALFGLAEVSSRSLLRHGAKEGGVELVFSVRDGTVKASRRLRRTSGGAQVRDCSIEVDGKVTKHSSNEMRQRVLELLEYGERRNPRARLDIFTYSTYTPQEDMRTVLAVDTKMHNQRKETLRRALDIEEYSQAANNLDAVRLQLDRDADVLSGMARDLDELRTEKARADGELGAEREAAKGSRARLEAAEETTRRTAGELERLGELEARWRTAQTASKEAEAEMARAEGELREARAKLEASLRSAGELDQVRRRLEEHSRPLKELETLEEVHGEMERLRSDLRGAASDLERARTDLRTARAAQRAVEDVTAELEGSDDPAGAVAETRRALESLRSERAKLDHEVQGLKAEVEGIDAEEAELTSLEGEARCPRCRQPLTEGHLDTLLTENRKRRTGLGSRIREAASRLNRLAEELEAKTGELVRMETLAEERRRTLQDLERARSGAERVDELVRLVEEHPAMALEGRLEGLEAGWDPQRLRDLRQLSGVVKELREAELRLEAALEDHPTLEHRHRTCEEAMEGARERAEEVRDEFARARDAWDPGEMERARTSHEEALKAEEGLRTRVSSQEDLLRRLEDNVRSLEDKVRQREGLRERMELHGHVSAWLSDRVIPAVRAMERSVMALMADEMDVAAANWFNQLVEDPDLVLAIDEDFVPVVTHQDFEMDVGALSGGERTAAAFAYRLALNGLVRTHATPGQRNLLILDEPTDGFSKEQLARMGNVFGELDAEQVVIVSHDRELRNFADSVYLVEKSGGSSTVRQVG